MRNRRFNPLQLELLEARLALDGSYVSPFTISGLNPAYINDIGTLTGPGRVYQAETTTTPVDNSSGLNPWYQLGNYYPPATGPEVQGNTWGPQPLLLAKPTLPMGVAPNTFTSITYYEQRLVAAAEAYIGVPYQHHHDPLWNPTTSDPSWPWSPVSNNMVSTDPTPVPLPNNNWRLNLRTFTNPYYPASDQNGPGIDCSDFTAAVYNVAAGIYINSAVGEQGLINASGKYIGSSPIGWNNTASPLFVNPQQQSNPDITPITPQFILGPHFAYNATTNTDYVSTWNTPGSLTSVINQLQPGDLLYIANTSGPTPPAQHFAGTSTNSSTTLTLTSQAVMHLSIGETVTGPGIPANTTIQQINTTTITLSNAAGAGAGAGLFTFTPAAHDVTHVVIYLGKYANLNGQVIPLVMSSHDNTPAVLANPTGPLNATNMPPPGVEILPFDPGSWFYQNFSFAMRLLPTLQMTSVVATNGIRPFTPITFASLFGFAADCQNAPAPTGTVSLTEGATTLTAAQLGAYEANSYAAYLAIAQMGSGYQTINITYSGDTNYPGIVETFSLFLPLEGGLGRPFLSLSLVRIV